MNIHSILQSAVVLGILFGAPLVGVTLQRQSHGHGRAVSAPLEPLIQTEPPAAAFTQSFVGVLLPPRMADLSPRAEAKVLEVRAQAGQRVRAHDVIVAFDLAEAQHDLAMAEAQLRMARADALGAGAELAGAREGLARRRATVKLSTGESIAIISEDELASARATAKSAQAKAASAAARVNEQEARVAQLRLSLADSELRAPFDGVVSAVNFEPGTRVHTGDVIARLVGGEGLRARIAVPEEAAAALNSTHARIDSEARTLHATIERVSPEPEPASRVYIVEARVDTSSLRQDECAALAGKPMRATLNRETEPHAARSF